ncbi:MAG TPA: hypothetical protein VJ875_09685, partial [Pyrinomonadaceae bacterium]|nr:hypothetical protein [Pyrinomonadaceae bacterium]
MIAALLLDGFVHGFVQGQSTVAIPAVTIENFGKINENYYRGSQPLADQFSELKTLGIKTVIDLREDSVGQADEWARAAGLQYIN